jgi:hypothetical protein
VTRRQHQLAHGHHRAAGDEHPARAQPVEHDADRHLQRRVDSQLQHREQREHASAGVEPVLRLHPGDAE